MLKILITGDFCPINSTEKYSLSKEYEKIFNDFLPVLQQADFRITNLECPLYDESSSAEKYGPVLKAATHTVNSLKFAGFDLVTLANNHIMDQGAPGLASTINCLDEANIKHVGTGDNLQEARRPQIINVKGLTVGILNFAENEFSNTHGADPGANPLSLASNFNDIRDCRAKVDKVIVIVHGGNETYELPSPRFKETLRFFADCGADAVIAHHTHCVSGHEMYNGVPIFYGLGNFVFDKNRTNAAWTRGIAVQLKIEENAPITFDIIPFLQNRGEISGLKLLTGKDQVELLKEIEGINEIINDDERLALAFKKFISLKTKQYSHFLEPYESRILHGLFGRKIIPSFYSKKKRMLLLNLIRCESHRDVVLNILSK